MGNAAISVIVPVYNVEQYLPRCLDSLLGQSFSDLEVILVEDGSVDTSGIICDAYAARDSRIRVIHKDNGGLSQARNVGLAAATGKYVGFVDSDDYVETDMFQTLYENMLRFDAQISVCGVYDCYPNQTITTADTTSTFAVDGVEALEMALESRDFPLYVWNKLYERRIFEGIRFPEGKVYEDAFVMIPLLDRAKRVAVTMEPKYHYMRRAGSVTTKPYSPADLDIIEAHESNYRYIQTHHPHLLPQAEFRCLWARFMALDKLIMAQGAQAEEKQREVIRSLRHSMPQILRCRWLSRGRKLSGVLLGFHKGLYKLCVKANQRKMR